MSSKRYGERAVLPAWNGTDAHDFTRILGLHDDYAEHRLVDLFSRDGVPWLARVQWSVAGQSLVPVLVSVPHSTRFTVRARDVIVEGANLHSAENRVGVALSSATGDTRYDNVYEVPHPGTGEVTFPVPAFASRVRLEVVDPSTLAAAYIDIYDAAGTKRARIVGNQQPQSGVYLGAASTLKVVSAVAGRLLFPLQL